MGTGWALRCLVPLVYDDLGKIWTKITSQRKVPNDINFPKSSGSSLGYGSFWIILCECHSISAGCEK